MTNLRDPSTKVRTKGRDSTGQVFLLCYTATVLGLMGHSDWSYA